MKHSIQEQVLAHLKLENNTYTLDLSIDDALNLGISNEIYHEIIESINQTNRYLEEVKNIENNEVTLFDPSSSNMNRSGGPGVSGTITTIGQEDVEAKFYQRQEYKNLRMRCSTNAAWLPVFTCRRESWSGGGPWETQTKVGFLMGTTDCDFSWTNEPAHETTITFRTSDSNGGTCNWECS